MTVAEFDRDINDFYDLKDFCWEHNCSICENIYDDDQRDEYINNDIDYYSRNDGWRDLADYLYNLSQSHYEFWEYDEGDGDWYEADYDKFEDYKADVREWAVDREILTDEAAEEPEYEAQNETEFESEDDPDEDFELEDEDCDIGEVFEASYSDVADAIARIEEERAKADEELRRAAEILNCKVKRNSEDDDDAEYILSIDNDDEFNDLIGIMTI